ncbi:vWA domain-containing protein [Pseudalkalibacillus berkeleyi]|uniref:VWA domain-containing protein n=1 Tax=Pseudalkalibacillus berkeleyi TaxID=1069813 RepID=A0ABS9H3N4_9BACL|nr:VWA domain-containing protein [Pseudalkalibacillus berkeleyi]MCF6139564.1 VWA domain-containing protein [Pseudalkalibacillus berkeleyi]
MRRTYLISSIILLILVIAGCSNDQSGENTEKGEKPKEKQEKTFDYPEAPKDAQGIIEQGAGEITKVLIDDGVENIDETAMEQKFKKEINELPKDLTSDQLYDFIIAKGALPYDRAVKLYDDFDNTYTLGREKEEEEKPKNIVFLLDASGSMAGSVSGGIKMDLAKSALQQVTGHLEPSTKVALRVYGHKGSNADKDKKVSCNSSEVVYPLDKYNEGDFNSALSEFKPTGWTPIASSLNLAKEDFNNNASQNVKNIIYVISDGVETCDGDPVQAAKEIHDSDLNVTVNVIGFDVNQEGQNQLKHTAQAGGGEYRDVRSKKSLEDALFEMTNQIREDIKKDFDLVKEGISLNSWYVKQSNGLRKVKQKFQNYTSDENRVLDNLLFAIDDELDLKEDVYSDLSDLIMERSKVMDEYSQERYEKMKQELEESKDKAKAEIEKREQEAK